MDTKPRFEYSYRKTERSVRVSDEEFTVPDYLYSHYKNQPEKEAIVFASTDGSREVVTYKDWYENTAHVAKCLVKLGVKKSEFVAVSMRNSSKWLYSFFGAALAGARPISLQFTYTDGSDVIAMMKKLQTCSMIILDPGAEQENWAILKILIEHCDKAGNVKSKYIPYLRFLLCHGRPTDNSEVLTLNEIFSWETPEVEFPCIYPDDIFTLFQTSGSTGDPKAVAHTHRTFIGIAKNWSNCLLLNADDDVLYNDRPFPWIGGFPLVWVTGHTRVTVSSYCEAPEDEMGFRIDVMKKERCTSLYILPPSLYNLINRQDDLGSDWPLASILTGGQPISKTFARCIGKVCKTLVCGYGTTEFTPCTIIPLQNQADFREYMAGIPVEGLEMKIVDENEQIVPVRQRGEIYFKSDYLFKEYYNDSERTKAAMTDDGWFKAEDIGYMTEEGVFYCEGRKSEMIISGGINVAPLTLETVIQGCPGIARAMCVPIPHDIMHQIICACVILEDGSDITEDDIRSYCEGIHNKRGVFTVLPTYYLIMENFPQTFTGKISRPKLTKLANEIVSIK